MGLVAPRHVGSSQTRARTRVPCLGRQILNHCATREAPVSRFFDDGHSDRYEVIPHCSFFFLILFIYLFMTVLSLRFFARAFSLVVASGGHSSSRCMGLSLSRPLLLRSTGSRRAGSVIVAHGPSCSTACGISPDQGLNLCPLHWQADSQPLRHQGSPSF